MPAKGVNEYAVKRSLQDFATIGRVRFVLKTDQEPAVDSLRAAIMRAAPNRIVQLDAQIQKQQSPVGEPASSGAVEGAIKLVQGMYRTLKMALEARYQSTVEHDHMSLPWLLRHAANTYNRFQVGSDGKANYERLRGRKFHKEVCEFGECLWSLKLQSVGVQKWTGSRWGSGVWLGLREESHEVLVGTTEGVIKVRTVRRKPTLGDRWNASVFNSLTGVPWQPVPGRGSTEVPSSVRLLVDSGRIWRCQRLTLGCSLIVGGKSLAEMCGRLASQKVAKVVTPLTWIKGICRVDP